MDYKKIVEEYEKNGCYKIENFLSPEEVEIMRSGVNEAINNMTANMHIHSAYSDPKTKEDEEYYISSADKVAYFFENDAFDDNRQLMVSDKTKALNKIAYALHWWNPYFKKISFCQKVKDLLRNFQYKDPVIVQSMLIFKHPKIGEIFRPHQDSTFLYTEPPSCIGLWFPIEDATIENGCLWYAPGSHKECLQFKDPISKLPTDEKSDQENVKFRGGLNEEGIHQRYVRIPGNNPLMNMEGKMPPIDDDKYIPIPAKKGDCVLIHGSVVHKSGRNNTTKPRIIYTYHAVEKDAEWSTKNWLQATEKLPFPSIYSN